MHWLVSFFGYDHATRADEESAPIESFVVDPMVGVIPHSDFIIGSWDFQFKIQVGNLKKKNEMKLQCKVSQQ
jgi:hypothetical protein